MLGTLTSYANIKLNEATFYSKELRFDNVKKGHHFSIKNNSGKTIYIEIVNKTGDYEIVLKTTTGRAYKSPFKI